MLPSGANNVSPGDGLGHVFVLDAISGAQLNDVATSAGSTTTPSNLLQLNAWTKSSANNTALRYYGGDMLGNMWRFDPDGNIVKGSTALLLGTATDASGNAQPITTQPVLTEIIVGNQPIAIVSFGTGRLLDSSDFTTTSTQSIYTVRDALNNVSLGNLRSASAKLVNQVLGSDRKVASPNPVNWIDPTVNGWYVDLTASTNSGERIVINGVVANSVLAYASLVPSSDPCKAGGSSYLYLFDLKAGAVNQITAYPDDPVTGLNVVYTGTGDLIMVTTASGKIGQGGTVGGGTTSANVVKRTSWRELTN